MSSVLFLNSCGGGSEEHSSAIEGRWEGDLLGGVIVCSNGASTAIGAGQLIREISLEVRGTDEIGSEVEADDGGCRLKGERTVDGFTANPVSGCEPSLLAIHFSLEGEDEADIAYDYAPQENEGISCDSTPAARLFR